MVCRYVNEFHISFARALNLYRKDYNIKSKRIAHLNYSEESARVNHLKEAWVQAAEEYSANFTAWQTKVKRDNGLQSFDMIDDNLKKIKLRTPVQLMTACLGAGLKLQKTLDYSDIPPTESHARLQDIIETTVAIGLDLDEKGMGSEIPSLVWNTMITIKRPEFNLNEFELKEKGLNNANNNNSSSKKEYIPNYDKPLKPILRYYNGLRGHASMQPQQSMCHKLLGNNIPDFFDGGECVLFNLHASWSTLYPKCEITDPDHLKTHICRLCQLNTHGLMNCLFIRSSLKPCTLQNDWRMKDYAKENVILRTKRLPQENKVKKPKRKIDRKGKKKTKKDEQVEQKDRT